LPPPPSLALADKFAIVRSIGEECIQARMRTRALPRAQRACATARTLSRRRRALLCAAQEDELRNLLDKKPNPVAYDGFEPSGRMHIAQARAQRASASRDASCVLALTRHPPVATSPAGRDEGAECE
jgi:hypothetical protein